MRIGVLALQGAFREHLDTLAPIGVEGVRVREPADLEGVSGLILPGGESTTMRQLIERWGLREPILDLAESGAPIFGTCAGMIVLAAEIAGGEPPILPLLDVTVERNAFGRQLDSFEAELPVPILGDTPVHAVFIRAPIIERTGPGVDVLARLDDGRIVAVRERNIIATAFHPELAGETRFHRLLATMAAEHDDPGRGLGPAPAPDAPRRGSRDDRGPRAARTSGKVRPARLTDLAALGELSRLCQSDGADTRSLGLPLSGPPIGVFSLFRLPLGAFRPNDLMYVYEQDGRIAGLVRVERESVPRRVDDRGARRRRDGRCGRHPLPARPAAPARGREARRRPLPRRLRRRRRQRRAADAGRASCATARSVILARPADRALPAPWSDKRAAAAGIRPVAPLDALAARRGCTRRPRPSPVARLEAIRLARLGAPGHALAGARARASRRSCASPTSRASSRSRPTAAATAPSSCGFVQVGVAKEDQPHYLKVIARPDADVVRPGRASGSGSSPHAPPRTASAIGARRHRTRANLRITDRPAPGGRRLRLDRQRHAADEGNPRPRRRTGPRAGRRPVSVVDGGPRGHRGPPASNRSTTSTHCWRVAAARDRRGRPRPAGPHRPHRGRHGPRPAAGGALPRFGGRAARSRDRRGRHRLRRRAHRDVRRRQPGRHRADAPPHQRDPQPQRQGRRADLPDRAGGLRHDRDHQRLRRDREVDPDHGPARASARPRCCARPPACWPTTWASASWSSTPATRSPATATSRTRRSARPAGCRSARRRSSTR